MLETVLAHMGFAPLCARSATEALSAALAQMTMRELRAKFVEVYGDATASGNRAWLVRRILWRLQALAEGDLSERARQRAAELASDADLRVVPSRDYQVRKLCSRV